VVRPVGVLLLAAGVTAARPRHALTQEGPPLRATLQGWAEDMWLRILDRQGAFGGRLTDRGILQQFNERIDSKYYLDYLTSIFSLSEDFEFYARESGARWHAGSITKYQLANEAEFRVTVPVSDAWAIALRFDKVQTPVAALSPVRVAVRRRVGPAFTLFAEGHLDPIKPGSDLGAGVEWRGRSGASAAFALTLLDAPNNWVFLALDAVTQPGVDTTIEYEGLSLAPRASASVPLSARLRLEGFAAYALPTELLAYEERDTDAGLRQEERTGYAGGLLEWTPRRSTVAGVFAATAWARTDREPLSPAAPVSTYQLTERTTELAAFTTARLAPRWWLDAWLRHTWRPERREVADPGVEGVDFELRSFNAQGVMTYRARSGFTLVGGVLWNRGTTPRTLGSVPSAGTLDGHHVRFRYDVGWRSRGSRFWVLLGSATDLDAEGDGFAFGGARGRFALSW
jgi:hypothetical protein